MGQILKLVRCFTRLKGIHMSDTFTFEEFKDSMTEEEVKGWHYEGISINELYQEYLLSLDPPCNYRPEWAY